MTNTRSGRQRPWLGPAVVAQLRRAAWRVERFNAVDDATLATIGRAVRDGEADVVVAVGGDGTVTRLADLVAATDVPLGIVPAGCGNLLARSLGIPGSPEAATRAVMAGRERVIDLGRVTAAERRRTFAIACGVGFDTLVMARTPRALKRTIGQAAYFATALALSGRIRPLPLTITFDGRALDIEAAQVLVANVAHVAGRVRPPMPIAADDGALDVIVVAASGRRSGLLAAVDLLREPNPAPHAGARVWRVRASEVVIDAVQRTMVECDGDVVARTPVMVSVLPAALRVRIPAA